MSLSNSPNSIELLPFKKGMIIQSIISGRFFRVADVKDGKTLIYYPGKDDPIPVAPEFFIRWLGGSIITEVMNGGKIHAVEKE